MDPESKHRCGIRLTLCSASSALIGTSQNVPTSGHRDLLALLAPGQVRLKNHAIIPPVTFQKLEKKKTNNPLAITNLNSCEVGQQCPGHKPGYEAQLSDSEEGSDRCTLKYHRSNDRSLAWRPRQGADCPHHSAFGPGSPLCGALPALKTYLVFCGVEGGRSKCWK